MTTPQASLYSRRYLRHGMLPQLVAFEAVVRLGSATRAGEELCMAQPTVSGHLRKLGEALGVRLFTMQGKHLVPSDAAQSLLTAAHEVFSALERCERDLVDLRAGFRLGAPMTDQAIARLSALGNTDRPSAPGRSDHAWQTHSLEQSGMVAPLP